MEDSNAAPRQQGAHPSCVDKNEWMAEVLADKSLTCSAVKVAVRLALHHNSKTGQCNPSIETLARGTDLKARAVYNAIGALRDAGFLSWTTPAGGSSNYRLERIVIGRPQSAADAPSSGTDAVVAPLHGDAGGRGAPLHGDAGESCTGMQGDPCTVVQTNPGSSNPRSEPLFSEEDRAKGDARPAAPHTSSVANGNVRRIPHFLPDEFRLTQARGAVARQRGIASRQEVIDAFDAFTLHHKGRGTKSPDWEVMWEGWCRKHVQIKKEKEQEQKRFRPAI